MARPERPGLLAEFATPEALLAAARGAREECGARPVDAFTPYPVDGLAEALGFAERRIPILGFAGGVFGLVTAYAMQIATNLAYPIDIGGRPLIALQAFALIGFELTVLFAVLAMMAGFFVGNRLPRYHHPLFDVDRFEHASRDGFFLLAVPADGCGLDAVRLWLEAAGAIHVDAMPS